MHKIALVLAIAAVGEGAVALHLVRQLHIERENTQTLQARVTELEQGKAQGAATNGATFAVVPQPPVSPFSTVQRQPAPPPPKAATAGTLTGVNTFFAGVAGPVGRAPDQEEMRRQINASMERQRALLKDPEYREAMHAQQKMALLRSNPTVARDLHLSPEQMEQLFGTMADQALRSMETAQPWDQQLSGEQMEEYHRKATEQHQANQAELKRVLGAEKFREWQEYQAMSGVRWEADRVRNSLASAGVPLDEQLVKPLLRTLQEQQQKMMQQMSSPAAPGRAEVRAGFITEPGSNDVLALQERSLEFMAQHQRRQREALASVLTPEQLKVIEDEHDSELKLQRLQLRMQRAQQEAGLADPTANGIGFVQQGVTVAPPVSD